MHRSGCLTAGCLLGIVVVVFVIAWKGVASLLRVLAFFVACVAVGYRDGKRRFHGEAREEKA